MRIFLLSIYDVTKSGGLSTYVKNIAAEYVRQGDKVEVITPIHSGNPLYRFAQLLGKALFVMNRRYWIEAYYRLSAWSIIRELRRKTGNVESIPKGTAFHFQDTVAAKYVMSKFTEGEWKSLLTLHGDLTNMNLSDKIVDENSSAYRYSEALERSGYSSVSKIIAVDNRLKWHALAFWAESDRVVAMPNFTDTSKFHPADEGQKINFRNELSIPSDAKVIFCPRRLVEKNGVGYAVDAFWLLPDGYLLIITGEWQERSKVLDKIERLGISKKIILTGDIPNEKIREYYCSSDMVVIPSISSAGVVEATSISAIESMACGIPVAASNIGWLPELITDGQNSFLAKEKDASDLAGKIRGYFELAQEEKMRISQNAVESVRQKFGSENYVKKVKALLWPVWICHANLFQSFPR